MASQHQSRLCACIRGANARVACAGGRPRERSPRFDSSRFIHLQLFTSWRFIKCSAPQTLQVQIHAAHGYLLSSFLNPRANNRDALFGEADPYSGALERRARLSCFVMFRPRSHLVTNNVALMNTNQHEFTHDY